MTLITGGPDLGKVWPEVERRLGAYLRSRGTSNHDVDDLVQECALRLLTADVPWTDADNVLQWCIVVARRARIDLYRRQLRMADSPDESVPDAIDVEREVEARLRLAAVRRAWHCLSPDDQRLLSIACEGGVPTPADRKDAVRVNVARHRARKRLTALMGAPTALVALILRSLRRSGPGAGLMMSAAVTALLSFSLQHLNETSTDTTPRLRDTIHATFQGASVAPPSRSAIRDLTSPQAPRGTKATGAPSAVSQVDVRVRPDTGVTAEGRHRGAQEALVSVCVGGLPGPAGQLCVSTGPQQALPVKASVRVALGLSGSRG